MTHWSRSLSASVRNVLVKTDVKVEGTRYRWFSGKLDKVMVVRQMAESVSGGYIFELEKGVEWCSSGIGFRSSSFSNIH